MANDQGCWSGLYNGGSRLTGDTRDTPCEPDLCAVIQIRMIAAIVHLGGYDLNDDRVETLCFIGKDKK